MNQTLEFPHEIREVTEEEDLIVKKYYKNYIRKFLRVGSHGYFQPPGYKEHASTIYNLDVRTDDVWVISFSRSGTTWLQELVWLVANDLDYETATTMLSQRFAYIEYPTLESDKKKPSSKDHGYRATVNDFTNLHTLASPRYVKSHLPLSLLPPKLLDTAKVFYIARDPRDVIVSFFFMHKLFRYFDESVELQEFWELFKKDLVIHMPIFPHVKESWEKRKHPNMMFLFYEEMQKDLRLVIDKVCKFLGKDFSDEQKNKLVEYLNFENMKNRSAPKFKKTDDTDSEMQFLRKGKSGNWVNYFHSQELMKELDEYMERNLNNTDLRFPEVNK
ncbi:sulfotransferase 1E1-like [Danaus plexippus]|uniref:sulfotransferase 1E1-like n=1 Tax=Danaus plexippus TaxID=13037 RepID=UPI002AAFB79D|nr:sulfotransferase 1E1-like [Danaus plexippus]